VADDYQYEFNGFKIGRNTKVKVLKVEGLFSMPDVVTSDTQREDADGEYSSDDETFTGRVVDFEVAIEADRSTGADDVYEQIQAATSNIKQSFPLYIKRPRRPERMVECKVRRRAFTSDASFARGIGKGALQFKAMDPRIYSRELYTPDPFGEANPSTSEGRPYPREYPLSYNDEIGGTISNLAIVQNLGTYSTPALIRIFGPMPPPILEHLTTSSSLVFNTGLTAGQFYEINLDDKSITLNGAANRAKNLNRGVSSWFLLNSGKNVLRLRSAGSTYTGQFTIQFRSAWV
jgi:hypothetical protein